MRGQRRTPRNDRRPGRSARRGALEGASGGGRRPVSHGHDNFSHLTSPPCFCCEHILVPPHRVGRLGGAVSYSPLNDALRFSVKALMPSSASSLTKTRPIASRSSASPTSIGPP